MSLLKIETDPSPRQLTGFGVAWLVFFAIVGVLVLRRGGPAPLWGAIWVAAVAVPAIGRVSPRFLRAVFVGLSYATYPFGLAVSFVLQTIVYFVVVTPIGLLLRLFGHDALGRAFDEGAESYWTPRKPDDGQERSFRQF